MHIKRKDRGLLDRYLPFFEFVGDFNGKAQKLVDGDRRDWYASNSLPFELPGFYPLTAEEREWANSFWGRKRPRWFIQGHGGGTVEPAVKGKSHPHWDQVVQAIEMCGRGQVFYLGDEECRRFSLSQGLALAATCDRFIGFDSGPFWVAVSNSAEAFAMFPFGPPNELLPEDSMRSQILAVYSSGACSRVPMHQVLGYIFDKWHLHWPVDGIADLRALSNDDGVYFIGPNTHDHLYLGHEKWLEAYMEIKDGDVCIDIGAHNGVWSMFWASHGASRVYSVEPCTGPMNALKATALARGHDAIVPMNIALSNAQKPVKMTNDCGGSHLSDDGVEGAESFTFDSVFGSLNRLDIVKIDTEGAEAMILRGGRKTLMRLKPRMIIEVHQFSAGRFDADPFKAIKEELASMGAVFKVIGGHESNFYLEAIWR